MNSDNSGQRPFCWSRVLLNELAKFIHIDIKVMNALLKFNVLPCIVTVAEILILLEGTVSDSRTPRALTVTVQIESQADESFMGGDDIWSPGTKQKKKKLISHLKGTVMQVWIK